MTVEIDNYGSSAMTGRPSYTQTNDTNEQTVFTSAKTRPRIFSCRLDVTTLTQNSTIRLKERTDGSNFRNLDSNTGQYPYAFTVASDDDGITLGPIWTQDQIRVSIQAGGVEGATRAIPYTVIEEYI